MNKIFFKKIFLVFYLDMSLLYFPRFVIFLKLIAMHWQCKISLHIHSIKSHHNVTLIDFFLKYLNKYLHVVIWLNARVKKYYTTRAYKLNPIKCYFLWYKIYYWSIFFYFSYYLNSWVTLFYSETLWQVCACNLSVYHSNPSLPYYVGFSVDMVVVPSSLQISKRRRITNFYSMV
jgi:hypothetical protein